MSWDGADPPIVPRRRSKRRPRLDELRVRPALAQGWQIFRGGPGPFVLAWLVVVAVESAGFVVIAGGASKGWAPVIVVGVVLAFAGQSASTFGVVRLAIDGARGRPVKAAAIATTEQLVPFVVTTFVLYIGFIIGWELLVVPGLYLVSVWGFAPWLVIDERLGIRAALRRSAEVTKGHREQILGLFAVCYVVMQLGSYACLVGTAVSLPVAAATMGVAYCRFVDRDLPTPTTVTPPSGPQGRLDEPSSPPR